MKIRPTIGIPAGIDPKTVNISPELENEIKRRIMEVMVKDVTDAGMKILRENAVKSDIVMLTVMHEEFGFGAVRLRRFFDRVAKVLREYSDRYDDDDIWVMRRDLKAIGCDVDELEAELEKATKEGHDNADT